MTDVQHSVSFGVSARILFIGDADDDAALITQCFSDSLRKYELVTVESGTSALESLRTGKIFVAPGLPEMIILSQDAAQTGDGEIIRQLRELPPLRSVPIVVVASAASPEASKRFAAAGASKVIVRGEFGKKCPELVQLIVDHWFNLAFNPKPV